jgi:uncharacterized membrane protein
MEKVITKSRLSTRTIAVAGILSAIAILLSLVPWLGYIPLGAITITTMHIPVIIAAILEGPLVGAFVGLIFGLSSLYTAATIFAGMPTAVFFLNPLVSVFPRILIGIVAYYVFIGIKKLIDNKSVSTVIGALAGTFTNTIGVLGMIYVLYAEQYVQAMVESAKQSGQTLVVTSALALIFGSVLTNIIAEALLAALISVPVVLAVGKIRKRA